MLRIASLMAVALAALTSGRADAQLCNMSGTWPTPFGTWSIRDDGAGTLTGIMSNGGNATVATALTGTRSGSDVTIVGGTTTVGGTLTTCDTFTWTTPVATTIHRASQSYCGDAVIGAGEECDDGNFVNGDICTVLCTSARCRNFVIEGTEQCDDGNATNGDGCSDDCRTNVCGNSTIEPGEQCDDGNLTNGDGCSTTCQTNVCGNGTIESGETCDDGNTIPNDTCSATCQFLGCNVTGTWGSSSLVPILWNFREDAGGSITGNYNFAGAGPAFVRFVDASRIGTAIIDIPFTTGATMLTCDQIETVGSPLGWLQRVSATYCGDGTVDLGEQCDDGNFVNGDTCTGICTLAACGNGVRELDELCDDGNGTNGDGCSTTCEPNVCSNGVIESGEQCDDSNLVPGDGCSPTCQINVCGNDVIESGEQCDDGNTDPDDTCSATCQFLGCNVTGVWAGSALNLVSYLTEDAGGVITGVTYSIGSTSATPVTGTRVGSTLSFVGGFMPVANVLTTCNSMNGGAFTRLTGSFCGDGVTDGTEQCDDGNLLIGDACNAACQLPGCGNGAPDPLEQCDDGNAADDDACKSNCALNVCGDGVLRTGVEPCDAGAANSFDPDAICRPTCEPPRCADGVIDAGHGEQCDDANVAIADGCDANCLNETVVTESVPAGGSVTTDPGNTGATPAAPVQTEVTSPNPGPVTLVVTSVVPTSQPGYQLLGKQVNIIAPPATAANPLRFVFEFDASEIPPDQDETTLVMFRNGVTVGECPGSATALPAGPCVTARERLVDGDVRLTVLTASASTWTLGVRLAQALTGDKLTLKASSVAAKRALVLQTKDPTLTLGAGNGGADDPVLHGASLRVVTTDGCGGPCDATYELPAAGWRYVGAPGANGGYKYRDAALLHGPIKTAAIKAGKLAKVSGKGAGLTHTLATDPRPVTVTVRVGASSACMVFGGTTKFVPAKAFSAKKAPVGDCS